MPRRRPSALRGSDLRGDIPVRVRYRPRRHPTIDGLSGSCTAALRRLERTRFEPGEIAEAFWHWKALAYGPLRRVTQQSAMPRCELPECGCDPGYFRERLEAVIHALPRKSARELRALVWSLDARILERARIIRADAPDSQWWRDHTVGSS